MAIDLVVGKQYNFSLYPAEILGSNFKNVQIVGVVSAALAQAYADIVALHVQVFPYLPAGVENNHASYDYVICKTSTGETTVIGTAWINQDTIELVESATITVVISDVVSSDQTIIANALRVNGFNAFTIKVG